MAHILVVDDEQDVAQMLRRGLTAEGYEVTCALDGVSALSELRHQDFDLVLLDINMPKLDGLQVCLRLRKEPGLSTLPVLFLTARGDPGDLLLGFEVGGDDYLAKPFDFDELLARVKALLRRSQAHRPDEAQEEEPPTRLQVGSLALDLLSRQATCAVKTVQLTPAEFDLLKFFMEHPNEIHSGQKLLYEIWDYPQEMIDTGLVRWHTRTCATRSNPTRSTLPTSAPSPVRDTFSKSHWLPEL